MVKIKSLIGLAIALGVVIIMASPASTKELLVFDKPLNLVGQLSQNVQFGLEDDFDTKQGLNAAIWTAILEGDYKPWENFKLYGMLNLSGDWAYPLYGEEFLGNDKWHNRQFDKSHDLALDHEYWRVLKEIHATWTPGHFMFRAGKQIVSWGEMIGFRLLDQINPLDNHKGISDLEFETTIIPVWMLRTDYNFPLSTKWLSNLNFQFIWNPNADNSIHQHGVELGNDKMGIWAPYAEAGSSLVGSTYLDLHKPRNWSEGQQVGGRIQAMVGNSLISFNVLYGRDSAYLTRTNGVAGIETVDGRQILHLSQEGFFPLRKMIGGMFATELDWLPRVGGITSPMFRLEWAYMFDSTFVGTDGFSLEKHDDQRVAASMDFGVPIRFLNPKQMFKFMFHYYLRRIDDVWKGWGYHAQRLGGTGGDSLDNLNHATVLVVNTNYWGSKIVPQIVWSHDWTNDAFLIQPTISYAHSSKWSAVLGANFFHGDKDGKSFNVFGHKDYIWLKVTYRFN